MSVPIPPPIIRPEALAYFESNWDPNEPFAIESASVIAGSLFKLSFPLKIPHTPFHIVNEDIVESGVRSTRLFVAAEEGQVRGALITAKSHMPLSPTEIMWFAVDAEYTDNGIGSKLLQFTEESLYQSSVRKIKLKPTLGARFFYEHHGYTYDDERNGGYFYMTKCLKKES